MPAGENGGENLLNHSFLTDNYLMQFGYHQVVMVAEFIEKIVEVAFRCRQG